MRTDTNYPYKRYEDFWQWLFDDWHPVFIIFLIGGYLYYLQTTVES